MRTKSVSRFRRAAGTALLCAALSSGTPANEAAVDGAGSERLERVQAAAEGEIRAQLRDVAYATHVHAAGLDPRRYNGACMVGLTGIVVKSHGRADGVAFARAVGTAALAARRGLTAHIAQALQAEGAAH